VLIVATGAQQPTISREMVHSKKPLLILDLSIPKNVADEVADLEMVTVVHLDYLSQLTDGTMERRKEHIPDAEAIIEGIKAEFVQWLETRKFAPVIKALKLKLKVMKEEELDYQSKKQTDFNAEQADEISNRIIQKITKQFANHLKDDSVDADSSLELIQKIFQLEVHSK
ncbi:MAG: glutamyl-tRNA reductase, partial [Flavobacteriales bacterium]